MNTDNRINLWRDILNTGELRRDFDHLFGDRFTPATHRPGADVSFVPACDIEEQESHYLLTLEMAGVSQEDVKMEVIDNQIVISGERRNESRKGGDGLAYSERRFGRFQRSFAIPADADPGQVEANYQDGILRVVVPKAESSKPRQIKITSGTGDSKFFAKFGSQWKEKEEQHQSSTDRVAS